MATMMMMMTEKVAIGNKRRHEGGEAERAVYKLCTSCVKAVYKLCSGIRGNSHECSQLANCKLKDGGR